MVKAALTGRREWANRRASRGPCCFAPHASSNRRRRRRVSAPRAKMLFDAAPRFGLGACGSWRALNIRALGGRSRRAPSVIHTDTACADLCPGVRLCRALHHRQNKKGAGSKTRPSKPANLIGVQSPATGSATDGWSAAVCAFAIWTGLTFAPGTAILICCSVPICTTSSLGFFSTSSS